MMIPIHKRAIDRSLLPKSLSERQIRIILFAFDCIEHKSYCPSIREIGEATDISSTSVVNYNLQRLEEGGYIAREPMKSRFLYLLPPAYQLAYTVYPDLRKQNVQLQIQDLRRENDQLRFMYETKLRHVQCEIEQLLQRVHQLECGELKFSVPE